MFTSSCPHHLLSFSSLPCHGCCLVRETNQGCNQMLDMNAITLSTTSSASAAFLPILNLQVGRAIHLYLNTSTYPHRLVKSQAPFPLHHHAHTLPLPSPRSTHRPPPSRPSGFPPLPRHHPGRTYTRTRYRSRRHRLRRRWPPREYCKARGGVGSCRRGRPFLKGVELGGSGGIRGLGLGLGC